MSVLGKNIEGKNSSNNSYLFGFLSLILQLDLL